VRVRVRGAAADHRGAPRHLPGLRPQVGASVDLPLQLHPQGHGLVRHRLRAQGVEQPVGGEFQRRVVVVRVEAVLGLAGRVEAVVGLVLRFVVRFVRVIRLVGFVRFVVGLVERVEVGAGVGVSRGIILFVVPFAIFGA
jgi:hypothetical protein